MSVRFTALTRLARFGNAAVASGIGFACVIGGGAGANAALLPDTLAPATPFPLIVTQSFDREFVAPGIERGTYRVQTSAGPLVVSLVHVNPHVPGIRFGTVLARDRIVSDGETISSMAVRTGAVAGINGDYFDIGNTNAPLGLLAQHGVIVRTPNGRPALGVDVDGNITFSTYGVRGTATDNHGTTVAIAAVNDWPPPDGVALLTPAYGTPAPRAGTLVAELSPVTIPTAAARMPPDALPPAGTYRVTGIETGSAPGGPTYALAFGTTAQRALATLPDVGDIFDVTLQSTPGLDRTRDAIGGGPLLLAGGNPVDDPGSPGYADRGRRIPVAAAARMADGDLVLAVIDGRHPAISIGLNRGELIALLAGIGATDAMQFDSGGSATLVARVLGEERASILNEPSDGVERPVADGFFVYDDAEAGAPARLVVRPERIEALPDTAIALRSSIVDNAGHLIGSARGPWQVRGDGARIEGDDVLHTGSEPLSTTLEIERAGVRAAVPLDIVPSVNRIAIVPERPNPDPGATVALRALAFDSRARPIAVGDHVRWTAQHATIDADGRVTAGDSDGIVTAQIGATKASAILHVGRHSAVLPGFTPDAESAWHFASVPAGGPGALSFTTQGTLQLHYDFSGTERAAYAVASVPLGEPLALSCAVDGDAAGEGLRVALTDRYGERSALTLAKSVDWSGLQRRTVPVPPALAPPIALQSIYAVGSLGAAPIKTSGTLGVRSCTMSLPGTAAVAP